MEVIYLSPGDLKPYAQNAKHHPPDQVKHIANSIRKFGFQQPIVVDRDNVVIIGHGRLMAAKELMLDKVPVVCADQLTEEQAQALRLADNKTNESEWDFSLLEQELAALDIAGIDMTDFGFEGSDDWFSRTEKDGTKREEGNEEYNAFLDKFEAKKTTDDCYTPENIYDAVAGWVEKEYGTDRKNFIRPFFPGGDYQRYKYPEGCAVVDNPPFSIMSEIIDFYVGEKIKFFLFAPGLVALNYTNRDGVCAICTYASVTYENGASVSTSFLTNMDEPEIIARATADLFEAIDKANDENEKAMRVQLPKYEYPMEVLTAAKFGYLSKYGQSMSIRRNESVMIRELDAMKEAGKGIYGNALLLSERAAAERAAATKWKLSEREIAIVRNLGKKAVAM